MQYQEAKKELDLVNRSGRLYMIYEWVRTDRIDFKVFKKLLDIGWWIK
jgi:hypothetical protein